MPWLCRGSVRAQKLSHWDMKKVRITRKFADHINGIDLRHLRRGDVVTLSPRDAALLIAEGWAEAHDDIAGLSAKTVRAEAAERASHQS